LNVRAVPNVRCVRCRLRQLTDSPAATFDAAVMAGYRWCDCADCQILPLMLWTAYTLLDAFSPLFAAAACVDDSVRLFRCVARWPLTILLVDVLVVNMSPGCSASTACLYVHAFSHMLALSAITLLLIHVCPCATFLLFLSSYIAFHPPPWPAVCPITTSCIYVSPCLSPASCSSPTAMSLPVAPPTSQLQHQH